MDGDLHCGQRRFPLFVRWDFATRTGLSHQFAAILVDGMDVIHGKQAAGASRTHLKTATKKTSERADTDNEAGQAPRHARSNSTHSLADIDMTTTFCVQSDDQASHHAAALSTMGIAAVKFSDQQTPPDQNLWLVDQHMKA